MRKNQFGIVTTLLILFIAFCVRGTVMSKENADLEEENRKYIAWEQTFMRKAKDTLSSQGYPDSGITMNWTKREGKRTYIMTVHHGRIQRLAKEDQLQLAEMILGQKKNEEYEIRIEFLTD